MLTRRTLPLLLNIGLAILLAGILFNTLSWIGYMLYMVGRFVELVVLIFLLLEIFTSRKASKSSILIWGLAYLAIGLVAFLFLKFFALLAVIFIAGAIYTISGRKKFIP